MTKKIADHEGRKYLKTITSPVDGRKIQVDIYAVLEAFGVHCQARGHAIKKLLMAGERGKGTVMQDLIGVEAALSRAIELQRDREELLIKEEQTPLTGTIATGVSMVPGTVTSGQKTIPTEKCPECNMHHFSEYMEAIHGVRMCPRCARKDKERE